MISEKDINWDVDYKELGFTMNHYMHELKRHGKEGFIREYVPALKEYDGSDKVGFCFLLSLLKYLDKDFEYDSSITTGKYILDPYDYGDRVDFEEDLDYDLLYNKSLPEFRDRGFLFDSVEEAI